jgi:hypothetical protein
MCDGVARLSMQGQEERFEHQPRPIESAATAAATDAQGRSMSERTKAKRLRAEVERLDQIVNPPSPEPPEELAPKPRLYVLAFGELEKRIVPNAYQIPDAINGAGTAQTDLRAKDR